MPSAFRSYWQMLHIVNAHQNTETGDIIGAQRPLRNRSEIQLNLRTMVFQAFEEIDEDGESYKSCSLNELIKAFNSIDKEKLDAEFLEDFKRKEMRLKYCLNGIALPGRFLVYMPTLDHTGVSRKIASAEERARLRHLVTDAKGSSGWRLHRAHRGGQRGTR